METTMLYLRWITFFALAGAAGVGCSCSTHTPARSRSDRIYEYDGGALEDAAGEIGDLPCDVADVVVRYCIVCHGTTPAIDAHPLLSSADWSAMSEVDPSRTVGAIAIERMRLTDMDRMPPPPAAAVTAAEIAAVQTWVDAGMPTGTCGVHDPFDVPPTCTSGRMLPITALREGSTMTPGEACISCHTMRGVRRPRYTLAGTAYPTAHEPDDCIAALPDAITIEVTDAAGTVVSMTPNSVGNFGSTTPVVFPITARAISARGAYEMTTAVMSGDCNGCHTQDGTTTDPPADPPPAEAPGRIIAP